MDDIKKELKQLREDFDHHCHKQIKQVLSVVPAYTSGPELCNEQPAKPDLGIEARIAIRNMEIAHLKQENADLRLEIHELRQQLGSANAELEAKKKRNTELELSYVNITTQLYEAHDVLLKCGYNQPHLCEKLKVITQEVKAFKEHNQMLEKCLREWTDKTNWIQDLEPLQSVTPGMHRADAITAVVKDLQTQLGDLRAAQSTARAYLHDAGYHGNSLEAQIGAALGRGCNLAQDKAAYSNKLADAREQLASLGFTQSDIRDQIDNVRTYIEEIKDNRQAAYDKLGKMTEEVNDIAASFCQFVGYTPVESDSGTHRIRSCLGQLRNKGTSLKYLQEQVDRYQSLLYEAGYETPRLDDKIKAIIRVAYEHDQCAQELRDRQQAIHKHLADAGCKGNSLQDKVEDIINKYSNVSCGFQKLRSAAKNTCEQLCACKEGYEDIGGLRNLAKVIKEVSNG